MRAPTAMAGSTDRSERENVAPAWHTLLLVSLIVSVAVVGALLGSKGASPAAVAGTGNRIAHTYMPMLVVQWALTLYVCRVGRKKNALAALLGRGWRTVSDAGRDLALAAMIFVVIAAVETAWTRGVVAATSAMLPRTAAESIAWAVVAISVGFGEEVVYRGYLQTQFIAYSQRASVGIAVQALLFGLAHGEQGVGAAVRAMGYGVVFGLVAWWRGSLVPGIAAHIAIDLAPLFRG